MRGSQRQTDKSKRDLKTYNEYDWLDMSLKGTLQQLTVKELEKYLTAHGLGKYGKKKGQNKNHQLPFNCHVLRNNEQDDESLSDDDYVVGTFGSDSE